MTPASDRTETGPAPAWLEELATEVRRELASEWTEDGDPVPSEGRCVAGAKRLLHALREAGCRAHMAIGHVVTDDDEDPTRIGHAYVRVLTDEGLFDADITADQFARYGLERPPVHIVPAGSDPAYVSIL